MKRIGALSGMRLLVLPLVFQIGYTVARAAQEIQAEPVDSLVVEAEHQAATQQKKEPKEITIYISGAHKAVAMALLDAVDEGTPMTGVADFDSLSATYGLMGVYRKGSSSSGFYGHRFRLTFPPDADVAVIAGAYWNLPYVQSVEPDPPPEARARKLVQLAQARPGDSLAVESPTIRVTKKLGAGFLGGSFGVLVVFIVGENFASSSDPIAAVAAGPDIALLGYTFGCPLGVSWVDSRDRGLLTWAGSMAGWFVGRMALERGDSWPFAPLIGATIASELWRKSPQDTQDSRVSVSLGPTPNGGLSAVATLRF